MDLTKEQQAKFLDLSCRLSPEHLFCDGEISGAQARRKEQHLLQMWRTLEKKVGRKVSQDEVWKRYIDEDRARRAS